MVGSAAALYSGAVVLSIVENVLPGGETGISIIPGVLALVAGLALFVLGARLPGWVIFGFGPLGAVLIGIALASTQSYGDGAVLYLWPAVWTACFFSTRCTVFIVVWIGIVHAVTLLSLPPDQSSLDRWLDVEVAVIVVVAIVHALALRNRRLIAQLAEEARIDPLTGLLNRRGFDERLEVELARSGREGTGLAVVRFDVDRFKDVNDSRGHAAGDQLLAWLGRVVNEQTRGVDAAARVGGDELVVILPDTDAAAARTFAERIRALVAAPDEAGRRRAGLPVDVPVSISAGVATRQAPTTGRELLEAADQALYQAKEDGRNRVATAPAGGLATSRNGLDRGAAPTRRRRRLAP